MSARNKALFISGMGLSPRVRESSPYFTLCWRWVMGSPIVAIHIRDSSAKLLGLQFKFWQVFCRIYTNSCIVQHFSKCFAMSGCNSVNSWTNQTAEFNPSAIWLNGMVLALATGCCKNLENALRHLKQFINCFISYLHWTCASLNRTTTVDCCMVTLSLYTLWNVYSDVCVYVSIVLHAGQSRWSFDLWPVTEPVREPNRR